MAELAFQHEQYEFEGNIEAIMSTLVARPVFYFFPQRIRVEGREAVREMYVRLCKSVLGRLDTRRPGADREMIAFATGKSQLLAEIEQNFTFPDGVTRRVRMYAVVGFEGDLLYGETTYSDQLLADHMDATVFDADFMKIPGVTRI